MVSNIFWIISIIFCWFLFFRWLLIIIDDWYCFWSFLKFSDYFQYFLIFLLFFFWWFLIFTDDLWHFSWFMFFFSVPWSSERLSCRELFESSYRRAATILHPISFSSKHLSASICANPVKSSVAGTLTAPPAAPLAPRWSPAGGPAAPLRAPRLAASTRLSAAHWCSFGEALHQDRRVFWKPEDSGAASSSFIQHITREHWQ